MSAIPHLNIPLTVQTDQVAPAMKKAEREIKASTDRMSKIKGVLMPGLGAAGAGPLGGVLGGATGALGGGALAIGAIALPFLAASKAMDTLRGEVSGAGEALKQFRETNKQNFAPNAVLLQNLANMENRMANDSKLGIVGTTMAATSSGGTAGGPEMLARTLQNFFTEAFVSVAAHLTGSSSDIADLQGQLSVAGPGQAEFLKGEIEKLRAQEAESAGAQERRDREMIKNHATIYDRFKL